MLAGHAFALVLTSPLGRARETAALAGFPDAQVDPDLHEWDYGDYEGITTDEIRTHDPGWAIFDGAVPGGEDIDQVADRAARVLARADAAGGDVLTAVRLGLDPREARRFVLDPATVSVIGHEHEWTAIRRWNASA